MLFRSMLANDKDNLTEEQIAQVDGIRPQMNEDCISGEPDFEMIKRLDLGVAVLEGVYNESRP